MKHISRRKFIGIASAVGVGLNARTLTGFAADTEGNSARGQTTPAKYIPEAYGNARVKPLGLFDAKITGGYLGAYVDRTREVSVLDFFEKLQKRGSVRNFSIVASGLSEPHFGSSAEDAELYKLIEAAGFFAPKSPEITNAFQQLINDVLSAQDSTGYLNTYYQNQMILKSVQPVVRFGAKNRFEFYGFGHLAQAGVAWKRSTGDDRLFRAGLKFADLLCEKFGDKPLPYSYKSKQPNVKYEHPNHEMAMVELYRMTGNRRYLDFAAHTLDYYKFWTFPEVYGHCVQENYLLAGGADVYLETGKPEMLKHLQAMWTDITERKMYLTGGVGNGSAYESYGVAYALPNATSYCETCAAMGKMFFDWRMLLATNQAKYADDLERTLYNAVLCGVSLTGTEYFYVNRIESKSGEKNNRRQPLFKTSCCPTNLHRLLGSLQQYFFTASNEGIQAQLYGNSELNVRLASGETAHLRETADYPRSGVVQFDILADGKFTLSLRIPQWTESAKVNVAINGKPGLVAKAGEYLKIDQAWKVGDNVTLEFAMKPRFIKGRELVADEKGKFALMRGPLVYCLESPDNANMDVFRLAFDPNATVTEVAANDLGGIVRLKCEAWDEVDKKTVQVSAIPYPLWANRGESSMRVWIPSRGEAREGNQH